MSLLLGSCEDCGHEVSTGQRAAYTVTSWSWNGRRCQRWWWWHRDCDDLEDHRNG